MNVLSFSPFSNLVWHTWDVLSHWQMNFQCVHGLTLIQQCLSGPESEKARCHTKWRLYWAVPPVKFALTYLGSLISLTYERPMCSSALKFPTAVIWSRQGVMVGSQDGLNLQQRVVVLPVPLLAALHLHRCNWCFCMYIYFGLYFYMLKEGRWEYHRTKLI